MTGQAWPAGVRELFEEHPPTRSAPFVDSLENDNLRRLAVFRQVTSPQTSALVLLDDLLHHFFTSSTTSGREIPYEYREDLEEIEWEGGADLWQALPEQGPSGLEQLHRYVDERLAHEYDEFSLAQLDDAPEAQEEPEDGEPERRKPSAGSAAAGAGKGATPAWLKNPCITTDAVVGDVGFDATTDEIDQILARVPDVGLHRIRELYGDFKRTVKDGPSEQLATVGGSGVSFGAELRADGSPLFTIRIDLQKPDVHQRNLAVARELLTQEGACVPYTQFGDLVVLGQHEQDVILSAVRWARWLSGEDNGYGWIQRLGRRLQASSEPGADINQAALDKLAALFDLDEHTAAIKHGVNEEYVRRRAVEELKTMRPGAVREFVLGAGVLFIRPVQRDEWDELYEQRTWQLLTGHGGLTGRLRMAQRGSGGMVGVGGDPGGVEVSIPRDAQFEAAFQLYSRKSITWSVPELAGGRPGG